MKNIKTFATKLNDTFNNPSFYERSITEPRGKALWFLFWVNVIAISIFAIGVLVTVVPEIVKFSKGNMVADVYPDGLQIDIKDGEASVNEEVPYFVSAPDELESDMANLLVIDTTENLSMETIKSYDSLAVLSKDALYFAKDKSETRIFSLSEAEDLTVTEDKVVGWSKTAVKWAYVAILPFTLMMIGLIAGFSFLYYVVLSFALALVPLAVGKVRKIPITYSSAYTISLYALVPVILIDTVATLFGVLYLPFWLVLIIFTMIVLVNVRAWQTQDESVVSPQ